jgi:hypothetical protein
LGRAPLAEAPPLADGFPFVDEGPDVPEVPEVPEVPDAPDGSVEDGASSPELAMSSLLWPEREDPRGRLASSSPEQARTPREKAVPNRAPTK